jgi:hypothetical protein
MSPEEDAACPVFEILKSEEYTQSSNRRRDALLATEAEKKAEAEAKGEGGDAAENLDDDEDEDFTFSKEAKRADKAAEVFVYQAASFPQDFIDRQLEHMGMFTITPFVFLLFLFSVKVVSLMKRTASVHCRVYYLLYFIWFCVV